MNTLNFDKEFTVIECCECSGLFAVTTRFKINLLENKQSFYCPNGHSQSYTKSTADKLREELSAKDLALSILRTENEQLLKGKSKRGRGRPRK